MRNSTNKYWFFDPHQHEKHRFFKKISGNKISGITVALINCHLVCDVFFKYRLSAQAMCMTGSDLNSSSKSWDDQENTTAIIYEEFYEQVPDIFMANNVLYLVLK